MKTLTIRMDIVDLHSPLHGREGSSTAVNVNLDLEDGLDIEVRDVLPLVADSLGMVAAQGVSSRDEKERLRQHAKFSDIWSGK